MKRVIVLAAVGLWLFPAAALAQWSKVWEYELGGSGKNNEYLAVAPDATRAYAAGRINDNFRLDVLDGATGAFDWGDDHDANADVDEARAVSLSGLAVAVAGKVTTASGAQAHLRVYDILTQTPVCNKTEPAASAPSEWNATAQTIDRVFVGGSRQGAAAQRWRVRGFDLNCKQLWAKYLPEGLADARVNGLAANALRLFAVGEADPQGLDRTVWYVRAYNPINGKALWTKQTKGQKNNQAKAVVASESAVYVVGTVRTNSGNPRAVIKAYRASDGGLLWEGTDLLGENTSEYVSVALAQQVLVDDVVRDVVVAGGYASTGGNDKWLVTVRDATTGTILWSTTKAFQKPALDHRVNAVAIADGYVLAAGVEGTGPADETDWRVLILNVADGTQAFSHKVDAGDDDAALAAAGRAFGGGIVRFYVAGTEGTDGNRLGRIYGYAFTAPPPVP